VADNPYTFGTVRIRPYHVVIISFSLSFYFYNIGSFVKIKLENFSENYTLAPIKNRLNIYIALHCGKESDVYT